MAIKPQIPNFKRVVKRLEVHLKTVADVELRRLALWSRDAMKKKIEDQSFESFWANPLSQSYLRRKMRRGLDQRVMIARGNYLRSIRVHKHSGTARYEVTVPSYLPVQDANGLPTKFNMEQLATVHEYGSASGNIPARPHWRPMRVIVAKKAGTVAKRIAIKTARLLRRDIERGAV